MVENLLPIVTTQHNLDISHATLPGKVIFTTSIVHPGSMKSTTDGVLNGNACCGIGFTN